MHYQNIYNSLIENALNRSNVDGYTEKHHIVPRSLGGKDSKDNLVILTAREHFIAHLLLAKIFGGEMWHAAHMMSNMKRYTNRIYKTVREEHAKEMSRKLKGHPNKNKGKTHLETYGKDKANSIAIKISKGLKDKPKTEEHRLALIKAQNNRNYVVSSETKEKISKKTKGENNPMWHKTHSEESLKKMSEANLQKVTCPHCGKEGGIGVMPRWHFDNCKFAPITIPRKKYPKQVCPHCGKEGGGAQMIAHHFDHCQYKSKG